MVMRMTKLEEKVFRDPVYGYVHVYDQLIMIHQDNSIHFQSDGF